MIDILLAGWQALVNYLTIQRIISLTIAFFLSGAISNFMAQGAVIKYFGPRANKALAYLMASVSGAILAVCSCSVLPMFASIRKKGAGIGPAVTFLFSGPAVNILAITFTFKLIGTDIGLVRVISAIVAAIIIGLIMQLIFHKSEIVDANEDMFTKEENERRALWQNALFFLTLIGILISGVANPVPTAILIVGLILQLVFFFKKSELRQWGRATFDLAKKIVPLFIVGIFLAGIISAIIPQEYMVRLVGSNSFSANIIAALFGALMYFATLTEVPIVNSFIELGMWRGPATALLLAGPSLSLPNMIVITRVMGIKKSTTYIVLVVLLAAAIGMAAGYFIYT